MMAPTRRLPQEQADVRTMLAVILHVGNIDFDSKVRRKPVPRRI